MLSGAGDGLAEERLEEEGDGYERREARASERDMTDSSESDMSERDESEAAGDGAEEGTELKGELGAWVGAAGQSIWTEGAAAGGTMGGYGEDDPSVGGRGRGRRGGRGAEVVGGGWW